MSRAKQVAEIVEAAIGALARLEAEELEAIERRLLDMVRDGKTVELQSAHPLQFNLELRAQTELLGRCVAMTGENLQVLTRLRSSRIEPMKLVQR